MCGPNSYYEFPLCHCSDIKVFVDTSRFLKMCGPNSYYEFPLCHCSDIKVFVDTSRFFKNVWAQFIL